MKKLLTVPILFILLLTNSSVRADCGTSPSTLFQEAGGVFTAIVNKGTVDVEDDKLYLEVSVIKSWKGVDRTGISIFLEREDYIFQGGEKYFFYVSEDNREYRLMKCGARHIHQAEKDLEYVEPFPTVRLKTTLKEIIMLSLIFILTIIFLIGIMS